MSEQQPNRPEQPEQQAGPRVPAPAVPPPADPTPPEQQRTFIGLVAVQFYVHRFLFGFCAHPILPLVLGILVALSLGLGEGFGVTDLIYHEKEWQQTLGGFVLAYVVVACAYAGFLFDTRLYPLDPKGKHWYDVPHWGFWLYCLGIVGSFALTLALAAAVYGMIVWALVHWKSVSGLEKVANPFAMLFEDGRDHWWFPLGGLIGMASAVGLGTLTYRFWEWASPRVFRTEGGPAPGAPPAAARAGGRLRYLRPLWLGGREYPAWWLAVWLLVVFLVVHLLSCAVVGELGRSGRAQTEEPWYGLGWVGPVLTTVLVGLVCWWRHRQLVGLWQSARTELGPRDNTGLDGYYYRGAGVLFVFAALGLFGLADNVAHGKFGEPTPVALFGAAIFVLVSLYTGITIAYRRAVPVIVFGGFVLLVFAGVPAYKFRFPGLEGDYEGKHVLELTPRAKHEGERWQFHQKELRRREQELAQELEQEFKKAGLNPGDHPDKYAEKFAEKFEEKFAGVREDIVNTNYQLIPPPTPPWRGPRKWDDGKWKAELDKWRQQGDVLVPYYRIPYAAARYPDKKPLFIISVSGGGHAAAVWTLGVLNRLEYEFAEKGIDFPAHVLLITGASGGMMGAAYYVTSLPKHGHGPDRDAFLAPMKEPGAGGRLDQDVKLLLKEDFLTPLVNRMLFNDVPAYFSPYPNFHDRGRRLEKEWESKIWEWRDRERKLDKSPFELTFAELKERELSGQYPFLVFAPMMIEDGRRLLISNLDLASVASNDGNGLDETTVAMGVRNTRELNYNFSRGELELFRMFPDRHSSFKLSTAVRMSASFPFFSPAVSLPTKPRRRVVDAGYYDNYGVCVAASWLFSTSHQDWMTAHVSKVCVIQIRASSTEASRRLEKVPEPEDHMLSRAMEELLSPVEGLNQARVGSASFRNDGQLELLSKWFRTTQDGGARLPHIERYFTTVTFELARDKDDDKDEDVTLSWYLGKKDQELIGTALEQKPESPPNKKLRDKIKYLLDWYGTPHTPKPKPKTK